MEPRWNEFLVDVLPKLWDSRVGLELICDGLGLDDPFIGSVPVDMNELGRFVAVEGPDLMIRICDVWALDLKALDEHFNERTNKWLQRKKKKKKKQKPKQEGCCRLLFFLSRSLTLQSHRFDL